MAGLHVPGAGRLGVLLLLAVLLNLAVPAGGRAKAVALRLVAPPDRVWVTEGRLMLAGLAPPGSASVEISGGVSRKQMVTVGKGGVFATTIGLRRGSNTIKVSAGKAGTEIRVYYAPVGSNLAPPGGFSRFYLHPAPLVSTCRQCHRLKAGRYDFSGVISSGAGCTAKCHRQMGDSRYVHTPVRAGECLACHNPHGSKRPAFAERSGTKLCLVCHQGLKRELKQKYVHLPAADGCIDCHDPHQSGMRYQLRAQGEAVSALCFTCHEQEMFTRLHRHRPVSDGDCIACHRPHASAYAKLLVAPVAGGVLCFKCHEERREEFAMRYVHAPARQNCTACHDPHSSRAEFMLKEKGGRLCASCHRELSPAVYRAIDTAKVAHPPVARGNCVACHRPHSSNYAPLLRSTTETLCFSCHTALGKYVATSKNRHGPVQTGDCTACHDVHGSRFAKLLNRDYPVSFTSAYAPEKYDLCFGCHNKDIARARTTTTLTNFRDGDENLHYLHVNSPKGLTCTACHDPHASNQPKHLRYLVPIGSGSYPIKFTLTATGGTCVVGCHAPKSYDREHPAAK